MSKRIVDVLLALICFIVLAPLFILCVIAAAIDTTSTGLFFQSRIGQYGKPFTIIKLRTMHIQKGTISTFGWFLRKSKIDEIPQLFNILKGDMSFVGPRPDISGYYDKLEGESRKILLLKPGLTSEAALKYAHEDTLLAQQQNPQTYNDTVIFPDKVILNLAYYYNQSFLGDLKLIAKTIVVVFKM